MATGINHEDLTGRGAVHPFGFVQDTDPALDAANKVTAHKAWLDNSTEPWTLNVRNDANDGWVTVLGNEAGGRAPLAAHLIEGPFMNALGGCFGAPNPPRPATEVTYI